MSLSETWRTAAVEAVNASREVSYRRGDGRAIGEGDQIAAADAAAVAVLNYFAEQLHEMEVGEPLDEGYSAAVNEVRSWVGAALREVADA